MVNEDIIIKLAGLEQRAKQIEQNLQLIDENSIELESLKFGLDDVQGKKGSEIFASVGRGIFVKAKIESDEFLVDVGGRNFVKKDVEDVKKMISENVVKLQDIRNELFQELEELNEQMEDSLRDMESN